MALSDEEASKLFHLRLILVSVLYTDTKFKNFEEMCQDSRVKKLWKSYEESEAPLSVPPESWRRQIRVALSWLHSEKLSKQPVRMVCEVQCMLRTYRNVRFRMHEVYVVSHASVSLLSLSLSLPLSLSFIHTYNFSSEHTGTKHTEQQINRVCIMIFYDTQFRPDEIESSNMTERQAYEELQETEISRNCPNI